MLHAVLIVMQYVYQVTQIQVSDVLREEAYLLFYMQSGIKKMVSDLLNENEHCSLLL